MYSSMQAFEPAQQKACRESTDSDMWKRDVLYGRRPCQYLCSTRCRRAMHLQSGTGELRQLPRLYPRGPVPSKPPSLFPGLFNRVDKSEAQLRDHQGVVPETLIIQVSDEITEPECYRYHRFHFGRLLGPRHRDPKGRVGVSRIKLA